MASAVAAVTAPSFVGLRAQAAPKATVRHAANVAVRAAPRASLSSESLKKVGQALVATGASLLLVAGANAATVKMGADDGALVFSPASISVSSGEKITWTNNAGFPHNIVFDEDEVPAGVNVDKLNHEDYFNGPGESYSVTLTEKGSYTYYCEPHQGAGMNGKITVK